MTQIITDTGMRGFLKWFQQDQPGIYAKIAPYLTRIAPQAFSAYTRRSKTLRNIYKTGLSGRSPQRLAGYYCFDFDLCSGALTDMPTCDVMLSGDMAPISVDYSSSLSTLPSYSGAGPSYTALPTNSSGNVITCPGPSSNAGSGIANAANTGTGGMSSGNAIGSAINAVAGTVMNAQNAAALAALVSSQLNQAANGQPPKNISSSSLGIPVVAAKSSAMGILLLALLAGGAVWALA